MLDPFTTHDLKEAIRHPFAFPGGYPTYLVLDDGDMLCHKCAKENYKLLLTESKYPHSNPGWKPVAQDILWEGEYYCGHCGTKLETAYGDE